MINRTLARYRILNVKGLELRHPRTRRLARVTLRASQLPHTRVTLRASQLPHTSKDLFPTRGQYLFACCCTLPQTIMGSKEGVLRASKSLNPTDGDTAKEIWLPGRKKTQMQLHHPSDLPTPTPFFLKLLSDMCDLDFSDMCDLDFSPNDVCVFQGSLHVRGEIHILLSRTNATYECENDSLRILPRHAFIITNKPSFDSDAFQVRTWSLSSEACKAWIVQERSVLPERGSHTLFLF